MIIIINMSFMAISSSRDDIGLFIYLTFRPEEDRKQFTLVDEITIKYNNRETPKSTDCSGNKQILYLFTK